MKCMIVLACVVALGAAQFGRPLPRQQLRPLAPRPAPRPAAPRASSSSDQAASILRYESDVQPDGAYSFSYETDNGISAQEQGTPRNLGGNPPVAPVVAQGSFSYTSPEGQPISIQYTADENGYQPQGDLPVPPPIPPQIARALEWIASHPPQRKK